MLIEMDEMVRRAEVHRLGDEIALLSAHITVATARLLDLIREFDALGGWGNAFLSCAHWLNWRVGVGLTLPASKFAQRALSPACHASPMHSRAARSRTPRSAL